MARRPLAPLAALVLATALPAASPWGPDEDNVAGLPRLRQDIRQALRKGEFKNLGPWNLRYVGPRRPGTLDLKALPLEAFETKETAKDGFEVHLKHPDKLFTKFTGELKMIGVAVVKSEDGPGLGRVDISFLTAKDEKLPLEEMAKRGMIKSLTWEPASAARFLKYVGNEAAFVRQEGHDDTEVWVNLVFKEEGHTFSYRDVLPRVGLAPEDEAE